MNSKENKQKTGQKDEHYTEN